MITKTYRTPSLAESVQLIRREMGNKAAIAEIKKVQVKTGFLGLKSKTLVDVTATIEERYLSPDQLEFFQSSIASKTAKRVVNPEAAGYQATTQDENKKISEMADRIESLSGEIKDIKNLLVQLQHVPSTDISHLGSKAVQEMELYLASQDMSPELRAKWKNIMSSTDLDSRSAVLDKTINFFLQCVPIYEGSIPDELVLVGPSGSGVTSSILKLAMCLKKSGLPCTIAGIDIKDTDKLEQLNSFAADNEMQFELVSQQNSLPQIKGKSAAKRSILIDTTGIVDVQSKEAARLSRKIALNSIPAVLVLSAEAISLPEAKALIRMFDPIGLILTHMDTSFTVGSTLNLLSETGLPVVFYGTGQSLEDDLEYATPERLISMLFRLDKSESEHEKSIEKGIMTS